MLFVPSLFFLVCLLLLREELLRNAYPRFFLHEKRESARTSRSGGVPSDSGRWRSLRRLTVRVSVLRCHAERTTFTGCRDRFCPGSFSLVAMNADLAPLHGESSVLCSFVAMNADFAPLHGESLGKISFRSNTGSVFVHSQEHCSHGDGFGRPGVAVSRLIRLLQDSVNQLNAYCSFGLFSLSVRVSVRTSGKPRWSRLLSMNYRCHSSIETIQAVPSQFASGHTTVISMDSRDSV